MNPNKKTCFNPECGKIFTPSRSVNKYCCEECAEQNNRKMALEKDRLRKGLNTTFPVTRVCKNCGKPFDAHSNIARHCSKECRKEFQRKAIGESNTARVVTCPSCGRIFTMKNTLQEVCARCNPTMRNYINEVNKNTRKQFTQDLIEFAKSIKR